MWMMLFTLQVMIRSGNILNWLSKKFHLTLMGEAKWYLGMHIRQHKDYIILDQDQYVKNITSRFEKQFKHPFKLKDSPSPSSYLPSKKDCLKTEIEIKETKLHFGNMNYRSIICLMLYKPMHYLCSKQAC